MPYAGANVENYSSGANASSDVVATANNGTANSFYINMGINGSGNTSGTGGTNNAGYLWVQGSSTNGPGTNGSSDLWLVAANTNATIHFSAGNGGSNDVARISSTGLMTASNFSGSGTNLTSIPLSALPQPANNGNIVSNNNGTLVLAPSPSGGSSSGTNTWAVFTNSGSINAGGGLYVAGITTNNGETNLGTLGVVGASTLSGAVTTETNVTFNITAGAGTFTVNQSGSNSLVVTPTTIQADSPFVVETNSTVTQTNTVGSLVVNGSVPGSSGINISSGGVTNSTQLPYAGNGGGLTNLNATNLSSTFLTNLSYHSTAFGSWTSNTSSFVTYTNLGTGNCDVYQTVQFWFTAAPSTSLGFKLATYTFGHTYSSPPAVLMYTAAGPDANFGPLREFCYSTTSNFIVEATSGTAPAGGIGAAEYYTNCFVVIGQ